MCTLISIVKCKNILLEGLNPFHGANLYLPENYKTTLVYSSLHGGGWGAGRPKLTWKKLTEKDCREWKLTTVDPQERSTWRSGVSSAMRAASYH